MHVECPGHFTLLTCVSNVLATSLALTKFLIEVLSSEETAWGSWVFTANWLNMRLLTGDKGCYSMWGGVW